MWLIVGLGNPGTRYEHTRHNAGWIALSKVAVATNASAWTTDKKNNAQICDGFISGEKVLFVKPLTFMNLSGASVAEYAHFYKIPADHIIVLHDDLDFPLGTIREQFDRSAAGHNGVISIIECIGTQAFHRIRIGIGPQTSMSEDFVLQEFSGEELSTLTEALDKISECVTSCIARAQ